MSGLSPEILLRAYAVGLFHRIISRLEWILSPVMREIAGAKIEILREGEGVS